MHKNNSFIEYFEKKLNHIIVKLDSNQEVCVFVSHHYCFVIKFRTVFSNVFVCIFVFIIKIF